jgi:hypothetical protein
MLRHLAPLFVVLTLSLSAIALAQTVPPTAAQPVAPRRSPAPGIRETVAAARYSFIRCTERSARAGESIPSRLAIRIDIEPSGHVRQARLRDREHAPVRLAQCLEGVAKRLRFERQAGPVAIEFPLNVDPSR